MIRAYSRFVPSRTLKLRFQRDAVYDTAQFNEWIGRAAEDQVPLEVSGECLLRVPEAIDYYWHNVPTRGVHVAVQLQSNLELVGDGVRIMMEPLLWTPAGSDRAVLLGTQQNLDRGTLRNIKLRDLTFDFKSDDHAPYSTSYALGVMGVEGFERRNITNMVGERPLTVTMTTGTPGIFTSAAHQLAGGFPFCGYFTTTGALLTGLEPYKLYYRVDGTLTDDTFQLSDTSGGAAIALSGTQSGVHTFHVIKQAGRGIMAENIFDWTDRNIYHTDLIQGYFTAYNYNMKWENLYFQRVREGIDIDNVCAYLTANNIVMENMLGSDESFDIGSLSHSTIDGLRMSGGATGVYLYTKNENDPTYAGLHRHLLNIDVTIDNTGFVSWPSHGHVDGDRFFFVEDTLVGAAPLAHLTIYYSVGTTTDGFYLAATAGGAAIVSAAGSGTINFSPINPRNIGVRFSNVVMEGLTGRAFTISNERETIPGSSGGIFRWGQEPQCEDITIDGFNIDGGLGILVYEGINISVLNGRLKNIVRPDDANRPQASIALRQAESDTQAISDSSLSATVRNVKVMDSEGSGLSVLSPTRLTVDGLTVEGYNSTGGAVTGKYGVIVSRPGRKSGTSYIGNIDISGGGANSLDISIRDNASDVQPYKVVQSGKWRLEDSGSAALDIDIVAAETFLGRDTAMVPSQDTTATATIRVPIYHNTQEHVFLTRCKIKALSAIAGDAVNYTTLRARKCKLDGTLVNLGSTALSIDNVARTAAEELGVPINDLNNDALLAPGEQFFLEFAQTAAGSVVPPLTVTFLTIPFTV